MLDPVWLLSFVTTAETRNFTAAGTRLGLGQPTVSGHVRKLEAACGRRLFVRDTHNVTITHDGEVLLGFARMIIETGNRALQHFSGNSIRGRIRLGVSEDVVLSGLPNALRHFTSEYPDVELELTVGLSEALHDQLNAGNLDLVFLKRRLGETHGEFVARDPLVWIAAQDFELFAERPTPLVLLAAPSLTRSAAFAALREEGRRWHVACTSESQSGVHAAVLAGLGVAAHARSLAPLGVVEIDSRLLPPLGEIEFVVIGRRGAQQASARALASVIKSSAFLPRRHDNLAFSGNKNR
jgi:DNA-binding transcriptional LysR family regulator